MLIVVTRFYPEIHVAELGLCMKADGSSMHGDVDNSEVNKSE